MGECALHVTFLTVIVGVVGFALIGLVALAVGTEIYKEWKAEKDGDNHR